MLSQMTPLTEERLVALLGEQKEELQGSIDKQGKDLHAFVVEELDKQKQELQGSINKQGEDIRGFVRDEMAKQGKKYEGFVSQEMSKQEKRYENYVSQEMKKQEDKFDSFVKETKIDFENYTGALQESFGQQVETVAEGIVTINRKLDNITEMVARNTEDIEIIKMTLDKKVDREELRRYRA